MAKTKIYRLGDLQLKIMKILWARSETAVAEVHEALSLHGEWAFSTIATMLRKMEARSLVHHRVADRKFLYRPAVKEDEVTRGMAAHLMEAVFEGSLSDMVAHLLTAEKVSRRELDQLEALIAERRKKL